MQYTVIGDSLISDIKDDKFTIYDHPGATLEHFVNNFIDLYKDVNNPIFCLGINDLKQKIDVVENYNW